MPWSPEVYNQFKTYRFKPFFDLMELLSPEMLNQAVDIGCGTGEQTAILAEKFPNTSFLGIDSSKEMLGDNNRFATGKLHFRNSTIEEFTANTSQWDLIFSNAALQWADDHWHLFPSLIAKLNAGGQFAVQMPWQKENLLNALLLDIVSQQPFSELLKGFRRESPLLSMDEYGKLMFDSGLIDLNISLKVYPLMVSHEMELYQFISGSALIPYMERLQPDEQALLTSRFLDRIKDHFKTYPAIYVFKRILLYGRRGVK